MFGIEFVVLLPLIVIVLGIVKGLVDIMASLTNIAASIFRVFSDMFTAVTPALQAAVQFIVYAIKQLWVFICWVAVECYAGIVVVFEHPVTLVLMCVLMISSAATTRVIEGHRFQTRLSAAEAAAHAEGHKQGIVDGLKQARGQASKKKR